MIVLFTDFGVSGPYQGQMIAALAREAPQEPVISLFADAPAFDPLSSSYLLAAYAEGFPPATVFLCVIDPGVGGDRLPLILEVDQRYFVGPDNGLFELLLRRAERDAGREAHLRPKAWRIDWRPERPLSASFHGRDLFAPVAARLAIGMRVETTPLALDTLQRHDGPDQLARVIYVDHYGNVMTGLFADALDQADCLDIGGRLIEHAAVFSERPAGQPFWYVNSNGLVEIAVNRDRADRLLGLAPGHDLSIRRAGT